MDQIGLKKMFPGLTIMGGIDYDAPLTDYTPEQMELYVKEILKTQTIRIEIPHVSEGQRQGQNIGTILEDITKGKPRRGFLL